MRRISLYEAGVFLLFLIATTNIFANNHVANAQGYYPVAGAFPSTVSWAKKTISVDIFDMYLTKNANCTYGDCLCANARYEGDPQYGRTYLSTNIRTQVGDPVWTSCALESIGGTQYPHIAGWFGCDRGPSFLKYVSSSRPVTGAYVPTGPGNSVNAGVQFMTLASRVCTATPLRPSPNNLDDFLINCAKLFRKQYVLCKNNCDG